jgi:predicted GIY-YIG superfamily endonuclease
VALLPRGALQGRAARFKCLITVDRGLVYFEFYERVEGAIRREKQIKKWNRAWKINLIEESNPGWRDLWPTMIGDEDVDSRFRGNDGLSKR